MVTPSHMRHMLGAFIGGYCLDIYNNLPLPNYGTTSMRSVNHQELMLFRLACSMVMH